MYFVYVHSGAKRMCGGEFYKKEPIPSLLYFNKISMESS